MLFDEVWCGALNLADGFANDLDVADNRVLNLPVLLKGIEIWHGLEIGSLRGRWLRQYVPDTLQHAPDAS